ncbi:MAG: 4Fe-4S binding protein [Bauldia sp.]|nr:4Fe-4S binding protein [Bauldia sp.]
MVKSRAALRLLLTLFALLSPFAVTAASAAHADNPPPLAERLTPEVMAIVYPQGAERLGEPEGRPPSIAIYEGETIVAYIFSTLDVVRAPGYSSYPFDIIAAVTPQGIITGAVVIDHREPHVSNPTTEGRLDEFLLSHAGYDVNRTNSGQMRPDFVHTATISARAMRVGIIDAARFVIQQRLGRPPVTEPTLDRQSYWPIAWEEMISGGSISRLTLTSGQVATMMAAAGHSTDGLARRLGAPDDLYSQVYVALGSSMSVFRNISNSASIRDYINELPEGSEVIFVGSLGPYDVFGQSYNHSAAGYRFDRFSVIQGDNTFVFTKDDFKRFNVAAGRMNYSGIFVLPPGSLFEPLQPFTLEFKINGPEVAGVSPTFLTIPLDYRVPDIHVLMPPPEPVPAYVEAWSEARTDVMILVSALIVLTLILAFQGTLAKHRRIFNFVRTSFLVFTLVWLGWTAGGQLSTVHLINYATAPLKDLDFGFYLSEPLIVIIASFTLVSLVILGRGVFCGWLCPFGALQELLAKIARFLRLPQWTPSEAVNNKLWLGKYIAAVLVIAATFVSPDMAAAAEEIEPFKTAITSLFVRAWPFELYAAILLIFGLFTERAYCRYVCPLGGTLAALDRMHLVDVLKRRPECGSPCHLCEHSCPVKAIDTSGKINMAECFQCLDCQVEYYDDHRCPPLVKTRKQLARAGQTGAKGTPVRVPPFVPVPAREQLA